MIVYPIYNFIALPNTRAFYQREYMKVMSKRETISVGEEVLLINMKEMKNVDEITPEDFYPIGVRGQIMSIDENNIVEVKAEKRVDLHNIAVTEADYEVEYTDREDIYDLEDDIKAENFKNARDAILRFVQNFQWGVFARNFIMQCSSLPEMVSRLSIYFSLNNEEKYAILEEDSLANRDELLAKAVYEFIETVKIGNEASEAQKHSAEEIYRENAIKKQIEILQEQLDALHPENVTDVRKFETKIEECGMNEEAKAEALKVLNRMKQEGKNSHEYGLLYDYLDFVTSLSWKKEDYHDIDLEKAREILEKDHFGLKKVKERIIQQIAVMTLNKKNSGSILLFVGAPGTGKTSIGQSIANALDRKYVRVSLGGIRDEADIRGHRRTYIGAMAGRIMEGIKRSGVSNPVMVLDEVDKIASEYRGDPASALLEVLDPEQNHTFTDHYMNVPYDLSDVFFVCTANTTDTIPEPLLNRMEVIKFSGYTATEKYEIAKKHLLPKSMENMGISKRNLKINDKAMKAIISDYTMEAGVRGLKKQIDTLCRVAAVKLVSKEKKSITVSPDKLKEYLDRKPIRHDKILEVKKPGIVTGLAWTAAGGDILFIETTFTKGRGNVIITGQLGDVMKESVRIAISLVKERFPDKAKKFDKNDLHIHVPAGSVPKDGPSAGITLVTALSSLVLEDEVNPKYAMTGEVSLRGNVMPIGGLPEKLMAAVRAGVTTVFIPEENVEDLEDVAAEVKDLLTIIPVHEIGEVLSKTLGV